LPRIPSPGLTQPPAPFSCSAVPASQTWMPGTSPRLSGLASSNGIRYGRVDDTTKDGHGRTCSGHPRTQPPVPEDVDTRDKHGHDERGLRSGRNCAFREPDSRGTSRGTGFWRLCRHSQPPLRRSRDFQAGQPWLRSAKTNGRADTLTFAAKEAFRDSPAMPSGLLTPPG
jgi:hypothetical protein